VIPSGSRGPSGGEGAQQWMTMLTELRNRGIADALIVCCDGLKGLTSGCPGTVSTCQDIAPST
jgi:putative transposase